MEDVTLSVRGGGPFNKKICLVSGTGPSQVSPLNLQQCSQSATHDGIFSYSPAMSIAAMVISNI